MHRIYVTLLKILNTALLNLAGEESNIEQFREFDHFAHLNLHLEQ